MNIRIYQIAKDRDAYDARFMPYSAKRPVDPESYDKVFEGNVDCGNLEEVYNLFNRGHPLNRGHSLSVSDVVENVDNGTFHYCDRFGFKQVDFDPTQAHTEDDLLKVVVVEPGREPYVSELRRGLEPAQNLVGGYIEHLYSGDGTITVADALVVLRAAARLVPVTPEILEAGDVDGDGAITVADALAILRVAAKLIPSL